MAQKILVIDDEPDTALLLKHALSKEAYEVECAMNGREGLKLAHKLHPDLILLDIMMQDMTGWEVLSRLREFSLVPVIMLTAVGGEEATIRGLDLGADDYITKPFGIRELRARIRAALRRGSSPTSPGDQLLILDGGDLIVDPCSYKVLVRGDPVDLTPTEHKLLFYLARNVGQVLSHEQILEEVWGLGYEGDLTSVKVYIRRLRTKIEAEPRHPRYILTRRGVGYSLAKF